MTPDDARQHRPDPPGPAAPGTPDASGAPGPAGPNPPPPVDVPPTVDDLASALVDGLLAPDDASAARARPEVVARAAQLEAGRATLRQVSSPDPAARDRAVTAALAAFDEAAASASSSPGRSAASEGSGIPAGLPGIGPGSGSGAGQVPVDLAAHRQVRGHDARRAGAGRAPRWLGAAAAVVAVLMGLVGLAALSSSGRDEDADTAADVGAAQEDADSGGGSSQDSAEAPSAAPESGGDGAAAERAPGVEAGDLGMFPSADALVGHLAGRMGEAATDGDIQPDSTASAEADQGAIDAFALCAGPPPPPLADPDGALRLHGRAVVDDDAVDVWVVDTPRGRRVVALDDACGVVVDRPLD